MTPGTRPIAGCFTNTGSYAGDWAVACPVCGADYAHIREAGTLLGGDEGTVYRGTRVLGLVGARRSALVVVFDGECGHSWALRLQQHKGVNLVTVQRVPRPGDGGRMRAAVMGAPAMQAFLEQRRLIESDDADDCLACYRGVGPHVHATAAAGGTP